jgi:hypothetical protein
MLGGFLRALVAAETEALGFSDIEKTRLLQASHRLASGFVKNSRYRLAGWACYKATLDWWDAGATGTEIFLEMP